MVNGGILRYIHSMTNWWSLFSRHLEPSFLVFQPSAIFPNFHFHWFLAPSNLCIPVIPDGLPAPCYPFLFLSLWSSPPAVVTLVSASCSALEKNLGSVSSSSSVFSVTGIPGTVAASYFLTIMFILFTLKSPFRV